MGTVTSMLKRSAINSVSRLTGGADLEGVKNTLNQAKSRIDVPELKIPDNVKNMASKVKLENLKVPDANQYIQPVKDKVSGLLSGVSLPSEIGGVELPKLPDMSSVTNLANGYLKDTGFSLKEGINFNDVKYAVTKGDITSLLDFNIDIPIDMGSINAVSDGTITSLDSFDMSETQREIDALTSQMDMESIDISAYF